MAPGKVRDTFTSTRRAEPGDGDWDAAEAFAEGLAAFVANEGDEDADERAGLLEDEAEAGGELAAGDVEAGVVGDADALDPGSGAGDDDGEGPAGGTDEVEVAVAVADELDVGLEVDDDVAVGLEVDDDVAVGLEVDDDVAVGLEVDDDDAVEVVADEGVAADE